MSTLLVFVLVVGFIVGGLLLLRDTANKPGQRPSQQGHSGSQPTEGTSHQACAHQPRCNDGDSPSSSDSDGGGDGGGGD